MGRMPMWNGNEFLSHRGTHGRFPYSENFYIMTCPYVC